MSGSYRLQPPSPFPYSGGSRMEQALVPGLTGPNSSSMLGYALGAQLQRQADQMNYDQDMAEYNLTAQREAERAQQAQLADREAQRRNAITAALVNRHGGVMVPSDYQLTPEQARIARETAEANVNLLENRATAAGRRGTSTRPDPLLVQDIRAIDAQMRAAETGLNALVGRRAQLERSLANIYDPTERATRQKAINDQIEAERTRITETITRLGAQRERLRSNPTAQPQAQAAPTPGTAAPASPGTGEVTPPPANAAQPTQAPRNTSEALSRRLVSPDQVDRARRLGKIKRIEADGTIIVEGSNGEQRVDR